MIPNLVVRDIRDINFEQLHKAGIVAIAFDKDNCLTRPYGNELHPPFEAIAIEKALGVHVLRHQEKKPAGGDELLHYFDSTPASRIAFVGDRALTDVVFGHNYGMLTILTRQVVTEQGDNPMAVQYNAFLTLARFLLSPLMEPTRSGGWNTGY
ncbi:hypothetical protein BG000_002054 [Podila horticola]|nr:hypothetical protein BG000_002054 [Podila horticola]